MDASWKRGKTREEKIKVRTVPTCMETKEQRCLALFSLLGAVEQNSLNVEVENNSHFSCSWIL